MLTAIASSSAASSNNRIAGFRPAPTPRPSGNEEGAFGHRIAAHLRPDRTHPLSVETLRTGRLAITRLRCDTGLPEISAPLPSEKAFIVMLQLRELASHELWLRGKPAPAGRYPERAVSILDLEQQPSMYLPDPFDCMHFYITRASLDEIADEYSARRISGLSWPHGTVDPVTNHLGLTILPALDRPEQTNRLFLDHAVFALSVHFAQTYGGMRLAPFTLRGGLAPWQERRSKEIISDRLEGDVSLAELANECRLSRSHFARAFKKTTGHSPHVWLLQRRVHKAKDLLLNSESPISDIALASGFADQSHLTKVFSKLVGATPGAWRRALRD
jgi:AraC family transcriptional regulator